MSMYKFYDDEGNVVLTYYTTPPQEVFNHYKNFIQLDEVPKPEEREGYIAVEFVDVETKEFGYKYIETPLTSEEKLQLLEQENEELKTRIELMEQALDDLLLNGGM